MSMINNLKSIIHFQLSSIEKTLNAYEQHLGSVENSDAVTACIDSIGRAVFQLMDKMEKNALTSYSKYAKGSQSQMNHRSKVIVSMVPSHTHIHNHNKQYLKQPYRRFYRENSTDVVWTKLNRALVLLDKGYRNYTSTNTAISPRGLSRRQKLQDAIILWKAETFEPVKKKSSSKYTSSAASYGGRHMYEVAEVDDERDMISRSPDSPYTAADFMNDNYLKKAAGNVDNHSRNKNGSRDDHHNKKSQHHDKKSQHHVKVQHQKSQHDHKSKEIPSYDDYNYDRHDDDANDHDDDYNVSQDQEVKSDRSDVSYSPDVFFFDESETLPKSTLALRERMIGSNNIDDLHQHHHDRAQPSSSRDMKGDHISSHNATYPPNSGMHATTSNHRHAGYSDDDISLARKLDYPYPKSNIPGPPVNRSYPQHQHAQEYKPHHHQLQSHQHQQVKGGSSLQSVFNSHDDGLAEAFEFSP